MRVLVKLVRRPERGPLTEVPGESGDGGGGPGGGPTVPEMPKRTNLLQEVVEIIHRHLAEDGQVAASAVLEGRSTGAPREVDVVIRANQAGHEVLASIEAIARRRKADRLWVDAMLGKHADLPTDKLVLVSESGFSEDARTAATRAGALPIAPEDLLDDDGTLRSIPALIPKVVTFPDSTGRRNTSLSDSARRMSVRRDDLVVLAARPVERVAVIADERM